MNLYIEKDGVPVKADLNEWSDYCEKVDRHVCFVNFNGVTISTIFLGIDHNFFESGDPILYETMVFGGVFHEFQRRYTTREKAEKGHKAVFKNMLIFNNCAERVKTWRRFKKHFDLRYNKDEQKRIRTYFSRGLYAKTQS